MGRRRKGRAIHGWLVVDKPSSVTSSAVVNKAKWAFQAQKAGHAGTLDPLATGVVAVAFGEATKTVPYVTDALKAYHFTVRWGEATNTDDTEGEVIATSELRPDRAMIDAALVNFRGDIEQIPPQFSAVKVDGERAYALARAGEEMDLAARPLWVERLEVLDMPDPDHTVLELVCGKGGYVRALARDLGTALGGHAHVTQLRRVWSGPFRAEEGVGFETLDAMRADDGQDISLLPVISGLVDLPELPCTPEGAVRLRNGNPGMVMASNVEFGDEAWASFEGQPVAIGVYKAGELHPRRVLNL